MRKKVLVPYWMASLEKSFRRRSRSASCACRQPECYYYIILCYTILYYINFCEPHHCREQAALWPPLVYRYLDSRKSNAICQKLRVETVYLSGPQTINFVCQKLRSFISLSTYSSGHRPISAIYQTLKITTVSVLE